MNTFYQTIGKPDWLLRQEEIPSITQKVSKLLSFTFDEEQIAEYRSTVLKSIDRICEIV